MSTRIALEPRGLSGGVKKTSPKKSKKAMFDAAGIKLKHTFSCNWEEPVRDFIGARGNRCPVDRKIDDAPDMHFDVTGFPCSPFSSLRRHETRLHQEVVAAKTFTQWLKVLEELEPAFAAMGSFLDIGAVMHKKVCQRLGKLGCYFVIVVKMDSETLGVPPRRPRYYLIPLWKDVSTTKDVYSLEALASLRSSIRNGCTEPVDPLLCPQRTQAKQNTVEKAVGKKKAHVGELGGQVQLFGEPGSEHEEEPGSEPDEEPHQGEVNEPPQCDLEVTAEKKKGSAETLRALNRCLVCAEPRRFKQKFCGKHLHMANSIKYLQKTPEAKQNAKNLLASRRMAWLAFDAFEKENPPGKRRKTFDLSPNRRGPVGCYAL